LILRPLRRGWKPRPFNNGWRVHSSGCIETFMRILRILFVICGCGLSTAALDREAFTFTKYDLEVRLEPEQQRLGARGKITLRNDSAQPQKIAVLQISSSLSWRSIKVDGKPAQFVTQPFASDIDHTGALSEAIVTLPTEVKPKESVELEIGYEGTIPLDTTRLTQVGVPEDLAKHTSWDQISPSFTAVRGAGYVAWYPIATESADFSEGNSLFEVVERWKQREAESEFVGHLHQDGPNTEAPPPPVLICGPIAGGVDRENRWSATTECAFKRLGTTGPTFASAKYLDKSNLSISLYVLSGHDSGAAKYADALDPATKFVKEWFGPPNSPIAIADMADPHAAPFESGALLLTSMAPEDAKLAQINTVHMLVHSAYSSPRPWVHEGLAHFAEALYREKTDGREAALVLLGLHQAPFLDSEKDVARAPANNPGKPLATTFDEAYYRSKAAFVWWMLRDMIGDDALKQAIHSYRAADDTDAKYVQKLVESSAKRDLGWFFDDWVYQDRGLPDFRVQSVHPWKNENAVQIVTVTLENVGGAGAEVPFTIQCRDGGVTRQRLEVPSKSAATTRVELSCGTPTELVINDGSVPESDITNNVFRLAKE
jgi:hypothetical protein